MAKLNKTYNILIRLGILILTFFYLYDQLVHKHNLTNLAQYFEKIVEEKDFITVLIVVLALLPVNLLLESYKWQLVIAKLEKVSLLNALKAVMAGISVSMFVPYRMGDFLGRIFILKKANRIQATLSTFLGGVSQLIATVIFGITAIVLFFPELIRRLDYKLNLWIYSGIILTAILILVFVVFSYLNFSAFSGIIKKINKRAYNKIASYIEVFSLYSAIDLLKVLLLSMTRYLIFSFQFYLLIRIFGISLDYFHAMILIAIIYLLISGIPTIALSELGVRGTVSLYVFNLYFGNQGMQGNYSNGIVSASSAIWIINLALPAVMGIIFIFHMKFLRNNDR
ncbi:MAG: flippase-like domain-containing protein [Bacteroidales bacterium]|nr:flippase-like domain-containing protein [Bacteroidales bacterium]